MEEGDRTGTFTDETWAIWEPLIEEVRPRGKTPPHDLRRTIAAIFWRHENGAKWRSIPAELGPWWRAAQLFIRWAKLGVWEHGQPFPRNDAMARSPAPNGPIGVGISLRTSGLASRSGALSQPDMKKQQRRSSRSSTSLPQQTGSSSNRP